MGAEVLRKITGIVVLFRGFSIEERTKTGWRWNAKIGKLLRTHFLALFSLN